MVWIAAILSVNQNPMQKWITAILAVHGEMSSDRSQQFQSKAFGHLPVNIVCLFVCRQDAGDPSEANTCDAEY